MRIILFTFMIMFNTMVMSCQNDQETENDMVHVRALDLSEYTPAAPTDKIHLLFIHHSTGGQLLADKGPDVGNDGLYKTHPNGGGLRHLLEENNYIVHEASFNSLLGDETDICHWNAKFRDHMNEILSCSGQDSFFSDNTRNKVIVFKSCFPNNRIESDGNAPGDPDSCVRTLANLQASYRSLLHYFKKQPGTLFVVVTAPPLAKPAISRKGWIMEHLKTVAGRPDTIEKVGKRARLFNTWLKDVGNGWLKDYELKNVVVFDYYDVLTGRGQSNWSQYPTKNGIDSHPSAEGNAKAAQEIIPVINRAVHRLGIATE